MLFRFIILSALCTITINSFANNDKQPIKTIWQTAAKTHWHNIQKNFSLSEQSTTDSTSNQIWRVLGIRG